MTAWITEYMAVLPPIPSAREPTAMAVNARVWLKLRAPKRKSLANCPIHAKAPIIPPFQCTDDRGRRLVGRFEQGRGLTPSASNQNSLRAVHVRPRQLTHQSRLSQRRAN